MFNRWQRKAEGNIKCELTLNFDGQCLVCGRTGHRKSECWVNDDKSTKSPSTRIVTKGAQARDSERMERQVRQVIEKAIPPNE